MMEQAFAPTSQTPLVRTEDAATSAPTSDQASGEAAPPRVSQNIYRHSATVRISHWFNVVCLFVLIGSGLQIFNAHPALYWGDRSDRDRPLLSIHSKRTATGDIEGITTILDRQFVTTGVLGYSDGHRRAFPSWATIPGSQWLAMGRQWHLFFAWCFVLNGLIFWAYGWISRHFTRDVIPTVRDLRTIGSSLKDHLRLKHPTGDAAKRYNVLQKLAYAGVALGLGPLIVLTGLTMSPTIDTAMPWLLDLFRGRQGARTIHFLACFSFVAFIVIHVSQVVVTGLFNNLRSMVTGWYRVPQEESAHDEQTTA